MPLVRHSSIIRPGQVPFGSKAYFRENHFSGAGQFEGEAPVVSDRRIWPMRDEGMFEPEAAQPG